MLPKITYTVQGKLDQQLITSTTMSSFRPGHMEPLVNRRPILCWLRTANQTSCFPMPFAFLAFVFRAYRIDPALRKTLLGVSFKRRQLRGGWDHKVWDSPFWEQQANTGYASPVSEKEDDEEDGEEDGFTLSSH